MTAEKRYKDGSYGLDSDDVSIRVKKYLGRPSIDTIADQVLEALKIDGSDWIEGKIHKEKVNENIEGEKIVSPETNISEPPDNPIPFPYKMTWLVVKETDSRTVMEKLDCKEIMVTNWQNGYEYIFANRGAFVTPCLGGYIAVLNIDDLLYQDDKLQNIACKFEEVQYFITHRVVDLYAWARYQHGTATRRYYYTGESGEVLWNEGELTAEERSLGLTDLPTNNLDDWEDVTYPEEDTVMKLAGLWGLDPYLEQYLDQISTGYVCKLDSGN